MLGMIVVFYSIEMVISTTAMPFFTSVHKIINVPKINCSLKYRIQFRLILEYYRPRLKLVSKRNTFIRIVGLNIIKIWRQDQRIRLSI